MLLGHISMRWAFQYKLLLPFSFSLFLSWLFLLFIGIVLTLSSQIPHSVCFLICVSTFYHCASTSQTTAQHTVHIYYRCITVVVKYCIVLPSFLLSCFIAFDVVVVILTLCPVPTEALYVTCKLQNCTDSNKGKPFPGYIDPNSLVVQDEYVFVQVCGAQFIN